ncbi:MAG: Polyketide cyclase / dehydrase and lipid transport [Ignavibacteria bacterium]|nr:Polyketide cyclase / dehydrase and lipid transport [Ignavibacteria bacterium]
MKFTCTIEIEAPLQRIVDLFVDTDNFPKWQGGFQSLEHISGEVGSAGAKSRIVYKQGKHIIELIETIIRNDLPNEFSALYEHKHMNNTMTNRFQKLNENRSILESEIEYTKFHGIIPKLMGILMPGMFKKQTQNWLNNFKLFVER